jgi:hypothetical protein
VEAFFIILGILGVYIIYVLLTPNKTKEFKPVSASRKVTEINASVPYDLDKNYFNWPEIGEFGFEVVGESNYQAALDKIAANHEYDSEEFREKKHTPITAYLVPESDNPYDDKAIRVDIDGLCVGYLNKQNARIFRRRLGAKKLSGQITCCSACITGGHTVNSKTFSYGIVLDIQPFDQ